MALAEIEVEKAEHTVSSLSSDEASREMGEKKVETAIGKAAAAVAFVLEIKLEMAQDLNCNPPTIGVLCENAGDAPFSDTVLNMQGIASRQAPWTERTGVLEDISRPAPM